MTSDGLPRAFSGLYRHLPGSQPGFTLLEVMVALAIIAIGLAAMLTSTSSHVSNAAGLQERTMAHWVAMNKMAEVQISKDWPALRKTTGKQLMAEHEWHWTMEVKKPDGMKQDTMRKVIISVRSNEDDEYSLSTLYGFVGKP